MSKFPLPELLFIIWKYATQRQQHYQPWSSPSMIRIKPSFGLLHWSQGHKFRSFYPSPDLSRTVMTRSNVLFPVLAACWYMLMRGATQKSPEPDLICISWQRRARKTQRWYPTFCPFVGNESRFFSFSPGLIFNSGTRNFENGLGHFFAGYFSRKRQLLLFPI